jgi:hypothetical protein
MLRALPIVGAAAMLAGCAGGGSGPSRAEFTRKADAACRTPRRQVEAIRRPGALILFAGYLDKTLPLVRAQRRALAAVEPPSSEKDEVAALLADYDAVLAALDRIQQGARSGDTPAIVVGLRQAAAANLKVEEQGRKLGLHACGELNPFQRK